MRETRLWLVIGLATGLATACGDKEAAAPAPAEAEPPPAAAAEMPKAATLGDVLAAQEDSAKARYVHRHPAETLAFFGIEPGMRVAEALPGGGWYSKILVPYLGADGELIGVDYEHSIWPRFGFMSDEQIEARKSWPSEWPTEASAFGNGSGANVSAYTFGTIAAELDGQVDAVLMVRALHNMARFEADGGYLTTALADSFRILKPGGVLGVVQHRAPDSMPDESTTGGQGYLREQFVIDSVKSAGFELVGRSQINANPSDQPGAGDIVWRLPPTYNGVDKDDADARAALDAIGESDRMTLLFRKPE